MRLVEKTTRLAKDPFRLQSLDPAPTSAQMRGTLEVVNLFDLIVSFKRRLYDDVLKEFAAHLPTKADNVSLNI